MGRYCDVYGQQVKLTGRLREVVLDLAADAKHHHDLGFDGVYVEHDDDVPYLAEGPVVLHRQDVEEVVAGMRREILGGCARLECGWANSFGSDEPLSHLQDIYRYQGDVNAFARLATWLAHTDEQELVWA